MDPSSIIIIAISFIVVVGTVFFAGYEHGRAVQDRKNRIEIDKIVEECKKIKESFDV